MIMPMNRRTLLSCFALTSASATAFAIVPRPWGHRIVVPAEAPSAGAVAPSRGLHAEATPAARRLIAAAEAQIGVTVTYDPAYVRLAYPGGDVPRDRGVCTDVVVRAYRDGLGLDLQTLVHEDMAAHFSAYPTRWGLKAPDRPSTTAACRTCRRSLCGAAPRYP